MIEIRVTGETLQDCLKQLEIVTTEKTAVQPKVEVAEVKEEPVKKITKKAPAKKEEPAAEDKPEPVKEDSKPTPVEEPKKEEPKKAEPVKEVGSTEARLACIAVKDKLGIEALKDLLAKFGAQKFSEVPEDQMTALHWEANHILEGK